MTIQEFLAGLAKDGVKVDQVHAKDCAGETAAFTDAAACAEAEAEEVKAALDEQQAGRVRAALDEQAERIKKILKMGEDLKNTEDEDAREQTATRSFVSATPQEISGRQLVQMVTGLIEGKLLVSMLGDRARKEGDEKINRKMNEIFDALTLVEQKFVKPAAAAVYAHIRKGDA